MRRTCSLVFPRVPGHRQWQELAEIGGSPGVGTVALHSWVCRSQCWRRADALICQWQCCHLRMGSRRLHCPQQFHPPCPFVSCHCPLPSLSSCPVPQHIPGISALDSRLSQPCSSHECPFPPAGSGCVLAQSHRSSRSVAIVTLLLVSESPGRSALGLVPNHLSIT